MLQSSSGWKWKKCETTLLFIAMHYWGYTSLEVKGRWGLLLPPCLLITAVQQPGTSSPPSWLKRSSIGGLLHQQLLSSAMVQYGGLLPVDRVVVLPHVFRYSWLLHHPPLAGISVFLQPRLQSPFGFSDVDLAAAAGDTIYHIGLFTKR